MKRLITILAAMAFATRLGAQQPGPNLSGGDSTLVDVTVDPAAPGVISLQLLKGVVYRASFSVPGVTIGFRATRRVGTPLVVGKAPASGSTAGNTFEIYPASSGPVDLEAIFHGPSAPARLLVWTDVRATSLRFHSGLTGWWEPGIEMQVAPHGSFALDTSAVAKSGLSYGLCFALRNGPSPHGVVNGCLFGVEGIGGGVDYGYWSIYAEPRFRVMGRGRARTGWATEGGIATRLAWVDDPGKGHNLSRPLGGSVYLTTIYGGGVYVARDQQVDGEGRGWRTMLIARVDRNHLNEHLVPVLELTLGRYW